MAEQTRQHPKLRLGRLVVWSVVVLLVALVVVNLFDIVPHVPLALPGLPYEHVGMQIGVNSGGSIDQTHRHSLDAYRAGLTSLISTQPAWAA